MRLADAPDVAVVDGPALALSPALLLYATVTFQAEGVAQVEPEGRE